MHSTASKSPPQPPPLFDATPESLKRDAQRLIDAAQSVWDSVTANIKIEDAVFKNVIGPIADNENARFETQRILRFYSSTSPSKELRDASNEVINMLNVSEVDLYSRHDMAVLVQTVLERAKNLSSPLDDQSQYYLEKLYRRFAQNGSAIRDESKRSEFNEKMKHLQSLVRECNKNLHEETTGLWLTLDELDGVPSSTLNRLEQGEGQHASQLWLPTKFPFSHPVITNAKKESTRRSIHYAIQNRMECNRPLFRDIVLLRDDTARLLGYSNYFTFKTEGKMVQNPETVNKLTSDIHGAIDILAKRDADELLQLKQEEEHSHAEHPNILFFWDMSYFTRQRNEKTSTTDSALREYFELDHTLAKLLDMFEHLFGARFKRVLDGQQCIEKQLTWHEDVRMYEVWNSDDVDDDFIGYAYLDFFPRDGKYTHAGLYPLTKTYRRQDGHPFYPSAALVMNYAKSIEKPTLLGIGDVRKLFHELGHLMHALFTRVTYSSLHSVDQDFIEAPSMMLEQFFWAERHIKEVSHHYSHIDRWRPLWAENSGRGKLPIQLTDEAVHSLAQANNRANVSSQLKEIFFTTYDMLIHSPASHKELEETNLTQLFNRTKTDIYHMHGGEAIGDPDGWEWGGGQTVFRNVINGYDAGYYSYILGRVFSLDMFETGFSNDTMSKEAGRRYRDMVMRVGGGQPEMKTLTEYLGHAPSIGPYLAWLGAADLETRNSGGA